MNKRDFGEPKGIKLLDIEKPFHVIITEADQQARQCDPWNCVLANALNRRPGVTESQVGASRVRFKLWGVPTRAFISANTRAMIRAYDESNLTIPVGIRIDFVPPVPSEKLGNGRPTSKVPKKDQKKHGPSRIRRTSHVSTRNIFVRPPD